MGKVKHIISRLGANYDLRALVLLVRWVNEGCVKCVTKCPDDAPSLHLTFALMSFSVTNDQQLSVSL